jgi:hypothetical protein
MKVNLEDLRQKLIDGAFIGFTLTETSGKPAADKSVITKLGTTKTGLSKT